MFLHYLYLLVSLVHYVPVWPCGLRRRSWPLGYWDRELEARSRNRCWSSCFCVVLFCVGRGLCNALIIRPKEFYQVSL
jgi:hypothetical protein